MLGDLHGALSIRSMRPGPVRGRHGTDEERDDGIGGGGAGETKAGVGGEGKGNIIPPKDRTVAPLLRLCASEKNSASAKELWSSHVKACKRRGEAPDQVEFEAMLSVYTSCLNMAGAVSIIDKMRGAHGVAISEASHNLFLRVAAETQSAVHVEQAMGRFFQVNKVPGAQELNAVVVFLLREERLVEGYETWQAILSAYGAAGTREATLGALVKAWIPILPTLRGAMRVTGSGVVDGNSGVNGDVDGVGTGGDIGGRSSGSGSSGSGGDANDGGGCGSGDSGGGGGGKSMSSELEELAGAVEEVEAILVQVHAFGERGDGRGGRRLEKAVASAFNSIVFSSEKAKWRVVKAAVRGKCKHLHAALHETQYRL